MGREATPRIDPPRVVAVTFGLLLALSGAIHGVFELLQGAKPVTGMAVDAIGPDHRYWVHGNEPAVTLLPTHAASGAAVLVVALLVAVWVPTRLHKRRGPAGFLALMVALTAVGGGVGHIAFFLPTWGWSTALPRRPKPWHHRLGQTGAARLWPAVLGLTVVAWLVAQHIAVYGRVPGLTDPDAILYTCWAFLAAALLFLNLAFPLALAARATQSSGPLSAATPGSR